MASGYPTTKKSMPCLASFCDAMSGVNKVVKFIPAIICPTSAF